MRVIRTEMYFDPMEIRWPFAEEVFGNPGVAVAFFQCDSEVFALEELPVFPRLENGRDVDENLVRAFLDLAIRNNHSSYFLRAPLLEPEYYANPKIIDYILQQDIIVERSPPEAIPFSTLLKGASAATIGTYIGIQAADGHMLLFLTVPAGIVVVGSAVAISKAIEKGLNRALERMSKRRKRPK